MRISVRIDSKAAQAQLRRWGGEFREKVQKVVARGIASEAAELKQDVRSHVAGQMTVVKKSFVKGFTAKVLDKDKNLIDELTVSQAKKLIKDGTISGGMIPKVETCIEAIERGVEGVVILNGKTPHAVLLELFTEHGAGTLIVP